MAARNPLWDYQIPPMWDIQRFALEKMKTAYLNKEPGFMNLSDCGTGKTRTIIEFILWLRSIGDYTPVLVLGTRTILQTAWGDDIDKFSHGSLTYSVANATNRRNAFDCDVDFIITNHDAVEWMARPENAHLVEKLRGAIMIVDESTAFKNGLAKRTGKAFWLSSIMCFVVPMTGTPMPQSILDIWSQAFLADGGKRLGRLYHRFMHQYMVREDTLIYNPKTGRSKVLPKWVAKEGAEELVFDAIADICVRFDSSTQNLPRCTQHFKYVDLPPKAMAAYRKIERDLMLISEQGTVTAESAASLRTKLLQMCSGSVYGEDGSVVSIHDERYELVLDLAEESRQAIIAFNYTHERDALIAKALKRGLLFAVIDGSTSDADRIRARDMFQAGIINYVFGHPRSMGHGITMTRGRRVIWCGPTDNGESFYQFNKRVNRGGQTEENDIIKICARGTREEQAYHGLALKLSDQAAFNHLFASHTKNEMQAAEKPNEVLASLLRMDDNLFIETQTNPNI